MGNRLTIGDIAVASILVNPRHAGFAPERKRFPKLRAFLDRMWSRPSFKKLIDEDTDLRQALGPDPGLSLAPSWLALGGGLRPVVER